MTFYIPIILFFSALIGIIFMLAKKLALVEENETISVNNYNSGLDIDIDIEKVKKQSSQQLKKIGYIIIFIILRFFIKLSYFTKTKIMLIWSKLKKRFRLDNSAGEETEKEASKYLRTISEYRNKLRTLKHKIKEEEGIE